MKKPYSFIQVRAENITKVKAPAKFRPHQISPRAIWTGHTGTLIWYTLIPEPRIPNTIQDAANQWSPLPFPDSGMLLRGIGGLASPDSSFIDQVSGGKVAPHNSSCTGMRVSRLFALWIQIARLLRYPCVKPLKELRFPTPRTKPVEG